MLVVILLSLKMIYGQQFSVRPAQCEMKRACPGSVVVVGDSCENIPRHAGFPGEVSYVKSPMHVSFGQEWTIRLRVKYKLPPDTVHTRRYTVHTVRPSASLARKGTAGARDAGRAIDNGANARGRLATVRRRRLTEWHPCTRDPASALTERPTPCHGLIFTRKSRKYALTGWNWMPCASAPESHIPPRIPAIVEQHNDGVVAGMREHECQFCRRMHTTGVEVAIDCDDLATVVFKHGETDVLEAEEHVGVVLTLGHDAIFGMLAPRFVLDPLLHRFHISHGLRRTNTQ